MGEDDALRDVHKDVRFLAKGLRLMVDSLSTRHDEGVSTGYAITVMVGAVSYMVHCATRDNLTQEQRAIFRTLDDELKTTMATLTSGVDHPFAASHILDGVFAGLLRVLMQERHDVKGAVCDQ